MDPANAASTPGTGSDSSTPSGPPDLDGQTAVVTGAAGGIGEAVCASLAREGADVVGVDVEESALGSTGERVEASGASWTAYECDVTDVAAVEALKTDVLAASESVEILVNAHGILSRTSLVDHAPADVERLVEVNLLGVLYASRAFLGHMVERGYGKIVSIGSMAGRTGMEAPSVAYSAAKAGVHGFTRSLAMQVAGDGVFVNAVAPGSVRTPMTDDGAGIDGSEFPLGRVGEPADVAEAVLYLASRQSNWTTGSVLDVTGGQVMR